jgi:hypothetical protein
MSEQSLGAPVRTPRHAWLRSLLTRVSRRAEFHPTTCWSAAGLILAVLAHHFWIEEGTLPNILFTAAVTLALISLVVLLTRRALFATLFVACLVALIVGIASAKHAVMNMVAHAYDIVFYLGSWSTISYLWSDQRRYMLALAGAASLMAALVWFAYRADGTRVPRRWAAATLAGSIALAAWGVAWKGERRHMQFHFESL